MFAFVFNQTNDATAVQHCVAQKRNAGDAAEDCKLLRRIAQRDQLAFAKLYDRYASVLYSLSLAIVKRRDEAEDILQECFLRVWQKAEVFDSTKGGVYNWLVTMTRNRAIDRIRSKSFQCQRQQKPGFDFDAILAIDQDTPLEQACVMERAAMVQKAFVALRPEQRQILQLAYFGGYSQTEIAHQLYLPLGTVKTRARQALKKLHTLLRNAL